jgi:hypothetical protein
MDAGALSTTPAARAALAALRAAAGANGPMERHCLRQFAIAERLASGRALDRELQVLAADVGFSDVNIRRGRYPRGPRPPFTPGYG